MSLGRTGMVCHWGGMGWYALGIACPGMACPWGGLGWNALGADWDGMPLGRTGMECPWGRLGWHALKADHPIMMLSQCHTATRPSAHLSILYHSLPLILVLDAAHGPLAHPSTVCNQYTINPSSYIIHLPIRLHWVQLTTRPTHLQWLQYTPWAHVRWPCLLREIVPFVGIGIGCLNNHAMIVALGAMGTFFCSCKELFVALVGDHEAETIHQ
jgi:hypothetical protein